MNDANTSTPSNENSPPDCTTGPAWTRLGLPDPHLLSDTDLAAVVCQLIAAEDAIAYQWDRHARPSQREPDDYRVWALICGRGFGKTRTGAETVRRWATGRRGQYAIVAKTWREVQSVAFESPLAGLINVIPTTEQEHYFRSGGSVRLVLTNGSILRAFSSEDPDTLRGYAFDGVWLDEFASYHVNVAQRIFDMAWFCLREAASPRMLITTTPRNVTHVRDLLEAAKTDPHVIITRGHTDENAANLSPEALAELRQRYEGTRLGRQELGGELLDDTPGALWTRELINACRLESPVPPLVQIITSVDPSGSATGDACGIVTLGKDNAGCIYVLDDDTIRAGPEQRYETICLAAARHGASMILFESAFGGDNIRYGIQRSWEHLAADGRIPGDCPRLQPSTIKGDKATRAQPVVALYEQSAAGRGRIYHARPLLELEDELTGWEPESGWSPNRLDAAVHGIRWLTRHAGTSSVTSLAGHDRTPRADSALAAVRIDRDERRGGISVPRQRRS